ncbi:MAG: hypothetical protein ACI85O_001471 [Saprospiraceae bacterium]|jgi:hypothetical protein
METGKKPLPSSPPPPNYYVEEDEMSLKDIILLVKDYLEEIKFHWKLIPLCILPIAGFLLFQAFTTTSVYPARITFMVTEEKGQDLGSIGGLLGSFGLGGGGDQSESSLEKVLQLFRSRRIIEETFFQKVTIEGRTDMIANFLVETYGMGELLKPYKVLGFFSKKKWVDELDDLGTAFKFQGNDIEKFSTNERLMLKVLYVLLVGDAKAGIEPMVGSTIDEKSGIMSISLSTVSDDVTYEMLLALYDQLSAYYIDKTVEKQVKIFEIAQFKTDSINIQLQLADRKLAEFEDGNRNLVWVRGELERNKLNRKMRILEILYGEAIKQLELSDFALRRKTPYVEIIDKPSLPIGSEGASKSKALLIGIVAGTFLALIFILGRKVLRDALKEEEE